MYGHILHMYGHIIIHVIHVIHVYTYLYIFLHKKFFSGMFAFLNISQLFIISKHFFSFL